MSSKIKQNTCWFFFFSSYPSKKCTEKCVPSSQLDLMPANGLQTTKSVLRVTYIYFKYSENDNQFLSKSQSIWREPKAQ